MSQTKIGKHKKGEQHYKCKLSDNWVKKIRSTQQTRSNMYWANNLGVSQGLISLIRSGKIWKHV